MLFCWKNIIFGHTARTLNPKIKKCRKVSKKTMPDLKTYLLTLNEKNKIFFQILPPKKFNGGGGKLKTHKMTYFFDLTEISAGNFQNRPDENLWPNWWPSFVVLNNLKQKQKTLKGFRECEIFENRVYSPSHCKRSGRYDWYF